MIEIIQEESLGLPKNIKQIGTPDAGERIYIENEAYQKLHPYEHVSERMVYVLMGHFDNFAGHDCVFVEDAVKMQEIEFQGNLPVWSDESWGWLYRKLRPEHENMIIVGWVVDICGQLPSMSAQLEHIHNSYFGGTHQLLLLQDSLEGEEIFYSNKNGYLKRRTGFYIYYNNSVPREQPEHATRWQEEPEFQRQENYREESYREYLNSHRARGINRRRSPQPPYQSSYVSTILLLLVVVALGYSAIQNQKKADEMEQALAQMNQLQNVMQNDLGTDTSTDTGMDTETIIRVEDIVGSITPDTSQMDAAVQNEVPAQTDTESTQVPTTQPESTQMPSTQIPSTQAPAAETLSEAEIYLQQGYYIVQQGDSLAGICRKIYNTSAMMDEICALNGIENPDAIYAGQYLDLP